jgi:hypothetical protein
MCKVGLFLLALKFLYSLGSINTPILQFTIQLAWVETAGGPVMVSVKYLTDVEVSVVVSESVEEFENAKAGDSS